MHRMELVLLVSGVATLFEHVLGVYCRGKYDIDE